MESNRLPIGTQIAYATGMMGWSIMINLINVILVYLYLPPADAGIPSLITQVVFFGFFNAIAVITASGRLVDAVYDPFIAQYSDKSTHPRGRRIPVMKKAIIPSFVFCVLVFCPVMQKESSWNIVWLIFTLIGFYVATTTYIIPYNALLPEIATSSDEKVRLSSWQSAGYVFGIGIASNAFNLAGMFQSECGWTRIRAIQATVVILASVAALCMAFCAFKTDEKRYSKGTPHAISIRDALRQTLANKNFQLFIVADFSYFIAVTIITSGLMYFVTVLLQLPETIGNKLMITMVLVSFIFYPVVNILARKIGKKILVIASFILLAATFSGVYFLGKIPLGNELQIYLLISLAAIPVASLNILPNAILAEIIEEDKLRSGQNKEAIYFAVRYFFVKIAQTFGIALFAMLLIYGKDVGNDHGIRMNGILGLALCLLAAIIFTRFHEQKRSS